MSYLKFNTEQLVDRWEDQRELKNLMGKYAMSLLLKKENTVFETFWSTRDDICYGVNNGWYNGREAIAGYYAAIAEGTALKAEIFKKAFADKLEGKTDEEIYGMGALTVKPMGTPVIEVATDGKTAKGLWYAQGSYCDVTPSGPVAFWTFETFAVDFIREGDQWKIWHMLNTKDVDHPCGQSWTEPVKPYPEAEDFAALKEFKMPEPNVPDTLRELYSPMRPFTKLPPFPEAYDSFEETFSYGI